MNQASVKGRVGRLLLCAEGGQAVHAQGEQAGGIHMDAADAVETVGGGGGIVGCVVDEDVQPSLGIGGGNLGGGVFRLPETAHSVRLFPLLGRECAVGNGGSPRGLVDVIAETAVGLGTHAQGQAHHAACHQFACLHRL